MGIYCLIDRSGSMANCVDDTIGGFNTFLNEQKKSNSQLDFSLNLFDHEFINIFTGNILDAPDLTKETFIPRGSTSLFDSIGELIKNVQSNEKHVIIVILTDGVENSSKIYTKGSILDIITMKKKENWEFIYLGANQDAIEVSKEYGICCENTLSFDTENICSAFRSLSNAVTRNISGQPVNFSDIERTSSKI